jgi:chromosomal replication initiation ATPase DnaA
MSTVCESFEVGIADVCLAHKGKVNYARSITCLLLKELTNMTYKEIARELHQKSSLSIKTSMCRLRKDMDHNADLKELYEGLKRKCSQITI